MSDTTTSSSPPTMSKASASAAAAIAAIAAITAGPYGSSENKSNPTDSSFNSQGGGAGGILRGDDNSRTSTSIASTPTPLSSFAPLAPPKSDYSERLSRKVLASVKSLNESLAEVRRSVAKIDSIANNRLSQSGVGASPGPGKSPSTPSGSSGLLRNSSSSSSSLLASPGAGFSSSSSAGSAGGSGSVASTLGFGVRSPTVLAQLYSPTAAGPGSNTNTLGNSTPEAKESAGFRITTGDLTSPFSSSLAAMADGSSSIASSSDDAASAMKSPPVGILEAATLLKRVLMSPAFKGTGVDDNTLAELSSVLPLADVEEIRAHVALRIVHPVPLLHPPTTAETSGSHGANTPTSTSRSREFPNDSSNSGNNETARVRTPGSTHSRPHTPPPADWHTPGSGSRGKRELEHSASRHSVRSHGSVRFSGTSEEIVVPEAGVDGVTAAVEQVPLIDKADAAAASVDSSRNTTEDDADYDDDDDDDDALISSNELQSQQLNHHHVDDDSEDSEDGLLNHPAQRRGVGANRGVKGKGGNGRGSGGGRSGLASMARGGLETQDDLSSSEDDSDDIDGSATDPRIQVSSSGLQGAGAGMNNKGRRSNEGARAVDARTGVKHGSSYSLPTLPLSSSSSSSTQAIIPVLPSKDAVPIFTFQRFIDQEDLLQDDGTSEEVPMDVAEVDAEDFYASEAEVVELRRVQEHLAGLPSHTTLSDTAGASADAAVTTTASSENSTEPSNAAAAAATPANTSSSSSSLHKIGKGMLPAGHVLPDKYTIIDTSASSFRVEDWAGGDIHWPTLADVDPESAAREGLIASSSSASAASALASTSSHRQSSSGSSSSSSRRTRRYEAFALRVVYEAGRTGFEDTKEFQASQGEMIAGRYRVIGFLGSAAFSSALSCIDVVTDEEVCLKVIKNGKDYFDQSLDEIKLLRYLNAQGDADEHNVLRLREYFYHREHLFLVTEQLKDNLYEFQKYIADQNLTPYFNIARVQRIAKQVLIGLSFMHSKGLVHCDLKPENILLKSISKCDVKVIDFGSSCFITDKITSYIQSRSYRAPEVMLGCLPYGPSIDIWSLGCILCEMFTGRVLFVNESVQTMLARMQSLLGSFPQWMLNSGRDVQKYFTEQKDGTIFEINDETNVVSLMTPVHTNLRVRLECENAGFLDFLSALLVLDPEKRPTAAQALQHPWMQESAMLSFQPYILS